MNSTGSLEGSRGGARVHTIPDVAMGALRVLSTWVNRIEGSSFTAGAFFEDTSLLVYDSA